MGLHLNRSAAGATEQGPRVLHVFPTALGRGAQVCARAPVDQLGIRAGGHVLVSLFDGDNEIHVDRALGLAGGVGAARGLQPPALARLACGLGKLRLDLVLTHSGEASEYLAPRAAALERMRAH